MSKCKNRMHPWSNHSGKPIDPIVSQILIKLIAFISKFPCAIVLALYNFTIYLTLLIFRVVKRSWLVRKYLSWTLNQYFLIFQLLNLNLNHFLSSLNCSNPIHLTNRPKLTGKKTKKIVICILVIVSFCEKKFRMETLRQG